MEQHCFICWFLIYISHFKQYAIDYFENPFILNQAVSYGLIFRPHIRRKEQLKLFGRCFCLQ